VTQTLLFCSRFSCLAILMGTLCVFATGGQAQEKQAGREIRATQALEPQVSLGSMTHQLYRRQVV